jgi:NAD(P)H dehydrogenase (quinone)
MIVVTAATGEFGRLATDRLLEKLPASEVAVAVRDVDKARNLADRGIDVRHGDYDQPDKTTDA